MNAVLKPAMHPDEWAARVQLAACYRIFDMLGWTEMIYNHITVRLPDSVTGGQKQFLINPFGLHYSEVTASNLVKSLVEQELVEVRATLEALNAKVSLVQAQTNLVVARYQVLASVGRLTAKNLALDVNTYDPQKHYDDVRNKFIGTGPSVE